ncbi:hypothetical protein K2D_32200 [Planctomycetes bacterium K2D]|uniref:Ser-Thr-rich glycosyl-phosphatidyl-inositol-anchored membrane family protein n=2 Tax=Botrimarina mediterranea TaxID=2528022 RepID=A0A518KAZ0_9BACT|nr:hypothetical protein Spa11_31690 [Botrimarina mediterranea]QDV79605.1 hypothetical protein K2D_32200 [Planctomycetes bacterium K2D]
MQGRRRPPTVTRAVGLPLVLGLLALGLCCASIMAQSPPTGTPTSEPVYWARHELMIPYRWGGAAKSGSEVILYYSSDLGRSWRVAGTAAPHVQSFRFQSPGDGEHWFAIRTYDSAGVATPAGPLAPEMRVVVDTTAPTIDRLDAQVTGGVLAVELSATDPGGFSTGQPVSLYAQSSGQPGWTPVPITAAQPSADGRSLRVVGQWQPPANVARLEVRATVEDRAGNRAERSTSANAAQAVAALKPSAPSFSLGSGWPSPTSRASTSSGDPFAEAERRHGGAPGLFASSSSAAAPPSAGSTLPAGPPSLPASATPWPAESPKSRPLVAGMMGGENAQPSSQFDSAPFSSSPFNSASFRRSSGDPFTTTDSFSSRDRERPTFNPATPSRLVNSAEFEFDYELEHTGRWGVAKVELWGTNDGGRSWRRFAVDADRESPIFVTTPGEGTYGFRLVVESVGGLEGTTPRPGDEPEAIVGVDLTKPQVLLGDVRQGVGYFADQLTIEWRAEDEHLAERPIDLFYSNRETGPWIPIATNLPNNGRHTWRLQRHLPRQLFVRAEARDEAGNVATAASPQAIEIDVSVASGSLKSVRASGN